MKFLLGIIFAAFLIFAPIGANADNQFGGCLTTQMCLGPSASITLVSFNLDDSTFNGGISPGVGYGLTFIPEKAPWAKMGVDFYASMRLGQSLPNQGTFSLMAHFADYIFIGIGPTVTQRTGQAALVQWSILGGIGVPIGGTPSYINTTKKE
jgi:hypothetical protein